MRKLASIQVVAEVQTIEGADAIERIRILGWWVVTKKGEYAAGDRVVYCEVDSLLPERDEFEFLRKNCFKPAIIDEGDLVRPAGFRIRTIRLRGQISQGICFPLSILPESVFSNGVEIDREVTDELGVVKFEVPVPANMQGRVKRAFPEFLSKTDETRVQILQEALTRHRGKTFSMTEKLDGSSFTAFLRDGEFGNCSRNLWLDETDEKNDLVRLSGQLELAERLTAIRNEFGFDVAVQGEVIGPGIQKNKYRLDDIDLRIFNVFDVGSRRYVDYEVFDSAVAAMGLTPVPLLDVIELNHTIDELVDLSIGTSVLNPTTQREGIVFRPTVEAYDETIGGRLSFKAINPKFLLKYDE